LAANYLTPCLLLSIPLLSSNSCIFVGFQWKWGEASIKKKMLSISERCNLRKASEREERESSTIANKPFKVPREALPSRAWGIYNPFPRI
jgi:hypothetical protein